MANYICKWHKELELFYRVKPVLILEGNVLDLFKYPENGINMKLTEYLNTFLKEKGYEYIIKYDGIRGFQNAVEYENENLQNFANFADGFARQRSVFK